jgi:hypothetical protein
MNVERNSYSVVRRRDGSRSIFSKSSVTAGCIGDSFATDCLLVIGMSLLLVAATFARSRDKAG